MHALVAQLNFTIGDLKGNVEKIKQALTLAKEKKADMVLFSELAISGYPPEDLLFSPGFIDKIEESLQSIAPYTKDLFVVIGTVRKNPKEDEKDLYNSAAVLIDGKIAGYKDKTLLPTYDVFDERRYFEPGQKQKVFEYKGEKIGILICEDMWQHAGEFLYTAYNRDPVEELSQLQPDLVVNISSSPYHFQKMDMRIEIFSPCAIDLDTPVIWCNQVGANDQLVFDGYSMYMNEKGEIIASAKGFEEDHLLIDLDDKTKKETFSSDPYQDLCDALVLGVRDYFFKQGFETALIGLSGGIDSALVAVIAKKALGKEKVTCLAMPSRFSSISSLEDAKELASNLDIPLVDIPIDHLFQDFLDLLSPHFYDKPFDTTEENLQARIRGMVLMAFSNKFGHIVLSTGNKSETALGYTTLYGDMCGGLGVINDVSKTQVYLLCDYLNEKKKVIPERILEKPPSAELKEDQTDQDNLPPYEVVDVVLEEYVENMLSKEEIAIKHHFDLKEVAQIIRKIHLAEYKRRQAPPGIKVTKKAFSKGREFPIVQKWQ